MKISIKEVLESCKANLNIQGNDQDAILMKFLVEGAKKCRCYDNYVTLETTLPIINFTAQLPNGVGLINAVRFTGTNLYPYYINPPFKTFSPLSPNFQPYYQTFYLENDILVFSSDVNYNNIDISYDGFALDSDGLPMITEAMSIAVQAWVQYDYARKNNKNYDNYIIENYRQDWRQEVIKLRGLAQIDFKIADVGAVWNGLFVKYINPYPLINTNGVHGI